MKILEPGNGKKKEWTLTVDCDRCGAKLLLDQGDLFRSDIMNTRAKMEHYVSFKCMQCKKETNIEIYYIPDAIYDDLPSSYSEF